MPHTHMPFYAGIVRFLGHGPRTPHMLGHLYTATYDSLKGLRDVSTDSYGEDRLCAHMFYLTDTQSVSQSEEVSNG
jgi:hypothetical protein